MGNYRLIKAILFFLVGISILSLTINAQEDRASKLSEIQKLKAENLKLKYQFSQCQVKLNDIQLNSERAELEREFRSSLGETDEKIFDWNSLNFTSKSK